MYKSHQLLLQLRKCWPVFRVWPPAQQHNVVERFGAVRRSLHTLSSLDGSNTCHFVLTWDCRRKKCTRVGWDAIPLNGESSQNFGYNVLARFSQVINKRSVSNFNRIFLVFNTICRTLAQQCYLYITNGFYFLKRFSCMLLLVWEPSENIQKLRYHVCKIIKWNVPLMFSLMFT